MWLLGAIERDRFTGRGASIAGAVLIVSFLTGCMSSGSVGVAARTDTGMSAPDAETATAASGTQAPLAVEMRFEDAGEQTLPYGDTRGAAESARPEPRPQLALAVVPSEPSKPAVEAVKAVAPGSEAEETVSPTASASRTSDKRPRLARLFAFGQPRPRMEVARASGSDNNPPARGATSRNASWVTPSDTTDNALPGVRLGSLFGINTGDESIADEPVRVASAAGLARLAPNGLRAQHDKVEMACFKPQLVHLLDRVRRHYGREIIVTSGYRSPRHNRSAGGARGSRHTTCEAADIQVPGVSKWDLAKYLRTVRGRGGVGTYCHTQSVHIDTGSKRDWNWRCRRR